MSASPGIMLLWRFAADEAERSKHECIEPAHPEYSRAKTPVA